VKRADTLFADNLEKNYQLIIDSKWLQPTDLANLRRLFEVCKEMKSMYEKPRGNVDQYRQRKDQLRKEFKRLVNEFDPIASSKGKKKK